MASFFQMDTTFTSGLGPLPSNTIANSKGKLKAITTRSCIVLDGPFISIPPPLINPKEDERIEETLTDQDLAECTIKVPQALVQKPKPPSQRNFVTASTPIETKKPLVKDEEAADVDVHLYRSMIGSLMYLTASRLDIMYEVCACYRFQVTPKTSHLQVVKRIFRYLKGQPKLDLWYPSESAFDLEANSDSDYAGANLDRKSTTRGCQFLCMRLISWQCKKQTIIATLTTEAEYVAAAICTLARIARDVFVPVGKFTFPAHFVIVDYESDPRVPLIFRRPFLRTARALIDVHGEEMILHDGDERLTLNMRHDTSSYSNQPQKESINMINIYHDSCEDFLKDLFATNHLSGNPTFSSHPNLTSPKVNDDIFDPEGDMEFTDELALITFLPGTDDLSFDIESDLKEIEYFLNHDPIREMGSILKDSIDEDNLVDLNDNLVDTMPEISSDFLPSLEYDSFLFEDFFEVDALPSTDKEDKVFNPGIFIQESLFEVTTHVAPDKNVMKISNASLILEDFNPPLYELPFLKEVSGSKTLLSFSSKNKEKDFKLEILTSKGVYTSLLPELTHRSHKVFKLIKILEISMEIIPCSFGEDIRILDVPCLHFYPP
uniref:Uncharacterized mitochondrial protein AtMg00810-like n=1 Tax=Tanacetum cinerariifolium TaxID=118510 RepID=A0A6L2LYV4_TANCI|nr:uncharacterized mitochondrial protein AtMg00810-like [Tanacetum cinerariifolium]